MLSLIIPILCILIRAYYKKWRWEEVRYVLDSVEALRQRDGLRLSRESSTILTHKLIDCWHSLY